ncbi:hypothetical protein MRY87_12495 [bacterium]|nr:hypothetical protein [bacterium]
MIHTRPPRLFLCLSVFTRCFVIVCALLSPLSAVHAQSEPILSESAQNEFQAITNALITLASDDSLSAGTYKLKSDEADSPDTDIDLYKVIGEFPVGDDEAQFVPLLEVSPAFLRLNEELDAGTPAASIEVESRGIGVGAGLQMKFFDDLLEITPRMKIEYSELNFDFSVAGVDEAVLDRILPDVDTWSYIPSLELLARPEVADDGGRVIAGSKVSFVYVNASTSNGEISDFSSDSWITKTQLGYEQPLSFGEKKDSLLLRPMVGRVDLHGSARNGFELNNFYEIGLDILTRTFAEEYFREVGFGVTYITEQEIQGWRFGFFGSLA